MDPKYVREVFGLKSQTQSSSCTRVQRKRHRQRNFRHLIQTANVDVVMLYSVPGKEEYYERFGLQKMKTVTAIFPSEDEAREGFKRVMPNPALRLDDAKARHPLIC